MLKQLPEINERMEYVALPVCPFYIAASGLKKRTATITITCEQPVDNLGFETETMIRFVTKRERNDYMEIFCCDRFKGCPYYQFLMRWKYPERPTEMSCFRVIRK